MAIEVTDIKTKECAKDGATWEVAGHIKGRWCYSAHVYYFIQQWGHRHQVSNFP